MVIQIKWFVGATSSKEELKKRYLQLAKEHHPDITGSSDDTNMKEINNEYDTLYNEILKGNYSFIIDDDKKDSVAALVAYRVMLLVRNKKNVYPGKFISIGSRCKNMWGWLSYADHLPIYHTAENDSCEGVNPGFNVCEVIGREKLQSEHAGLYFDAELIRVIKDKTLVYPESSEILAYALSKVHNGFRTEVSYETVNFFMVESQFGAVFGSGHGNCINKEENKYILDSFTAVFYMDGVPYECDINIKHLGPYTAYGFSAADIISYHYADCPASELFKDVDFALPDIAMHLRFDPRKDRIADWPFDAVISRYHRLGIISVYRHGHEFLATFNKLRLYGAFHDRLIDIEDFDYCCQWMDEQYNKTLEKFKRDVKKGRIKLHY